MRNRAALYALMLLLLGFVIFMASYKESERQQYQLSSAESQDCVALTEDDVRHLKLIGREALEQALKDHVARLYESWMKDDTNQPTRAQNGIRQGVRAYVTARKNLEAWSPSLCF